MAGFVELFPHLLRLLHCASIAGCSENDVVRWSKRLCFLSRGLGQGRFVRELSTKIRAEVERTMTDVLVASSGNDVYQVGKNKQVQQTWQ